VCLCGGLLLSMNTATMDGSRALYALSEEKMTIKQLGTLNRFHVPARAMTVDMLLNVFLVLYFGNIFFILAAGNVGYMFSHVLALSGVLLLRRDRPNWPRPIRLAKPWMVAAGVFCLANLAFIVFGLIKIEYTGYLWNADFTDPLAKLPEMIGVAAGSLGAGVIGYVIAQRQHGRPFRFREPSDEAPSQEAIDAARQTVDTSVPVPAGGR
jgi:amino acid transporter